MESKTIWFLSGSYGETLTHFQPREISIEFPLSATNRVQIKVTHPMTLEDFNTLRAMLELAGPGIIALSPASVKHGDTKDE